jgi:hypothetical protein
MQESGMPKDTQEIGLELQAQENDQGLLPGIIHDESPFTKGFRVKTKGRKVSVGGDDLAVMNLQTGELNGTAEITQTIAVDKEKFVKVFQMQIGAFFGLTSALLSCLCGSSPGVLTPRRLLRLLSCLCGSSP